MTTDARSSPALASTPLPTSPAGTSGPVRRKRTRRAIRAWALALLMAAGGLASVQALFFRKAPVEVRTTAAAYGLVEQTVASTKAGSVRSRRSSDLSADVAGVVVALHAREGDVVRQGDRLLSVDPRDAAAALAAAEREHSALEAVLAEGEALLGDARRERDRLAELLKAFSASQAALDQAQTRLDVAEATLRAARARLRVQEAAVERARLGLEKCDLRAPFDGVVAARFIEVGEWATPGRVVLRLLDAERLYVRAELDEVDIAGLRLGLPARVTLDPWRDRPLAGRLARIAPYVSEVQEQNRTVEVEIELDGRPDGLELRPGLSADVEVVLRSEPRVLRVPAPALLEGDRVLVAVEGRATARPLKLGLRNWQHAEVLEGLSEGEPVITSLESEAVREGARVRVVP